MGELRQKFVINACSIFLQCTLLGCTPVPSLELGKRVIAEQEQVITQLEMTGNVGGLVALAEEQVAAALDHKLSKLSQSERIKLLIDQAEWQRLMDRRNSESMGEGSIAPMLRYGREGKRLKNRFTELTVPEEVRQAFIAMRNAPVHFQEKSISLRHGELDFRIPEDKWRDGMLKTETIAQLNIPFCRKMVIGKDTFHIGIIEPTNYGVISSFGMGTESNLSIWKNGGNIANYLVGRKITIQGLSINDRMVKVSFLDKAGVFQQKEFNYQIPNSDSVMINHWTTERIN